MVICNNGKSKLIGLKKNGGGYGVGFWLGLVVIWILLDQLIKIVVFKIFIYGELCLIIGFFNLVFVYNKGVVFLFLVVVGGWQWWFFMGLGVVVVLFIVWLFKCYSGQKLFCFVLVLILGGVFGNVIDCVIYGYVVDFFDFYLYNYYWLVFNVVDCGIIIGVVLLIVDELWCVCC